jgi:glycine/serine hydroxymethyltransferase
MRDNFSNTDKKLIELHDRLSEFNQFQKNTVPLCAAENPISNFCKLPLNGDLQERYIMGNYDSYKIDDNFIGSQYLLPIYSMIHELCNTLFAAKYSDARTLSGMNCMTTLLMSLTHAGDKIAILNRDWGGHPSVSSICERLGLKVYNLPYQENNFDLDYSASNRLIYDEDISFILLAPSDILNPLAVEHLDLENRELFYDVSQIMGLIAGGNIPSPLGMGKNIVIFGGTHKTLPGPACGLILTNNKIIHKRFEYNINPRYLRHTQMHQVACLLFALLEINQFGSDYGQAIINTSNQLGAILEQNGFTMGKLSSGYSKTHQLFLFGDKKEMEHINKNAIRFGVTLNKKEKPLFKGTGIRLGTQEIARYGWETETLEIIGTIMQELRKPCPDSELLNDLKKQLPPKKLKYTFPEEVLCSFRKILGCVQNG